MSYYPADTMPGTPKWVRAAALEAIKRANVNASKWLCPLTFIGFYESSFSPAANLCTLPSAGMPVGIMQQTRNFYDDAWNVDPAAHAGLGRYDDPVRSFLMAIFHVSGWLTVSGGYDGIGTLDSRKGLLSRTDRGPRKVMLEWLKNPVTFNAEAARPLYEGY